MSIFLKFPKILISKIYQHQIYMLLLANSNRLQFAILDKIFYK